MKLLRLLLLGLILGASLFSPVKARDAGTITDWYIKDFQSEIVVNKDSSLDIIEKITADCGNLPGKHGIFRTIPTFYQKTASEKVKTPIKLNSITDFQGRAVPYSTTKGSGSITWKIGDPDKTVTGENFYKISYKVENAIRFDNSQFDELYWNLNGNFWQLEIDNFRAAINLPTEIPQDKVAIDYYTGTIGSKDKTAADFQWQGNSQIVFQSTETLREGEGITASITFPKGVFIPYREPLIQRLMVYLVLILPFLAFVLSFRLWRKYGRDPKLGRTEMVQYDPPLKLAPMELGMLFSNGYFKTSYISSAMIDLAVKKFIKIEELPKKGVFGSKDFRLILLKRPTGSDLSASERALITEVFGGTDQVELSELKNKFYKSISGIKSKVMDALIEKKLFAKAGFSWQIVLLVFALIIGVAGFFLVAISPYLGAGLLLSGIVFLIFSFLMRQRTKAGAEAFWQIEGFKLYMTKAERYRQQFYEKENIFEKFLPYAMVFGITGIWINNMKKIYGEEYFNTYHPYWYTGYALAHFDANSFEKSLNSIASSMTTTMASNPSSSGAGGGGFSGGGGGGGGGGGW